MAQIKPLVKKWDLWISMILLWLISFVCLFLLSPARQPWLLGSLSDGVGFCLGPMLLMAFGFQIVCIVIARVQKMRTTLVLITTLGSIGLVMIWCLPAGDHWKRRFDETSADRAKAVQWFSQIPHAEGERRIALPTNLQDLTYGRPAVIFQRDGER